MLFASQEFDETGKCVSVHFYHHSEVKRWQFNVGRNIGKPEKIRSRLFKEYLGMLESQGTKYYVSTDAYHYLEYKGIIPFGTRY